MNNERVTRDLEELFKSRRWRPERLRAFLNRYEVTPEIFLYRLTELLPQHFGIRLHFLRFNHEDGRFRLVKHLNMSQVLIPGGTGVDEHYCRRWLAIRILRDLESKRAARQELDEPLIGAQLSSFVDSGTHFLCIGMARHLALNPSATSSVSLGFRFDEQLERSIKFARDPAITKLDINGTCERCPLPLEDCSERAAPPHLLELERVHREIERELAVLAS
jgi:hypothetical protein